MDKQLARIFSLFLLAVPCLAQTPNQTQQVQTYYVDAITPGNDVNPGTAASPFATVAHVASIAATGNARVFVKYPAGTYYQLQMPYLNLKRLFIMQQGPNAAKVYDVANGDNAALSNGTWGTVVGQTGLVCDGSSTVATFTPVIGNQNFSAWAVGNSVLNSTGMTWAEGNTGEFETVIEQDIDVNASGSSYIRDSGDHGGNIDTGDQTIAGTGAMHALFLARNGTTTGYAGWYDLGTTNNRALTSVNITTNTAAICARVTGGITANYWEGTLSAVAIFIGFPTANQQQQQYAGLVSAVKDIGIQLPATWSRNTLTSGPEWVRQGKVTGIGDPVNGPGFAQEPSVLPIPNPVIVSGPNAYGMVYSWLNDIAYAETTNSSLQAWTDYPSNPIIPGHRYSCALRDGSTDYIFARNGISGNLDAYSGPDFAHMTLLQSSVISVGAAGQPDGVGVFNCWVAHNASGVWQMLYDCQGNLSGQPTYSSCAATASAPQGPWTKITRNPVNGFELRGPTGGPFFINLNGKYWAWGQDGNSVTPGTDIWRAASDSFSGDFGLYPQTKTYPRGTVGEDLQVADPVLLQIGSSVYMYYGSVVAQGVFSTQNIKLAIAPLTLDQLVQTTEGATTTSP